MAASSMFGGRKGVAERRFGREIFGLFLLFFTLLLFLSLFTYDAADPSLNHAVSGNAPLRNKGGLFGAYLAGFLNDIFGCVSILLPVALGAIGVCCVSRTVRLPWWRWAGLGLLTLCLLVLCAAWNIGVGDLAGGGFVGTALSRFARDLLSPFGSTLLWLFLFFVGLQLLCNLSWKTMALRTAEFWRARSEARTAAGSAVGRSATSAVADGDGPAGDDAFDEAFAAVAAKETGGGSATAPRPRLPLGDLLRKAADRLSRGRGQDAMPGIALGSADEGGGREESPAKHAGLRRPRRRKYEKDMPFVSCEDTGVPVDGSFAEQYGARRGDLRAGESGDGDGPGGEAAASDVSPEDRPARETSPELPVSGLAGKRGDDARSGLPPAAREFVIPDPVGEEIAPAGHAAQPAAKAQPEERAGEAGAKAAAKPKPRQGAELATPWSEAAKQGAGQPAPSAHGRPVQPQPAASRPAAGQPQKKRRAFIMPPLSLLDPPKGGAVAFTLEELKACGSALMTCLSNFNVKAQLVKATPGPVVTTYMLRPDAGVPVRVFQSHADDIALALKAVSVFVQAPVPGTDTVGIVIPNPVREIVNFREMAESSVFTEAAKRMALPVIIGKDTTGRPYVADLAKMPHLLVAGATGQGKSVGLNAMLSSLLLTRRPDELKLLLVDPKRVEMGMYEDEPHLIHPVVKEVEHASAALQWAVKEMDHRYDLMARITTKNISGYNARLRTMMEEGSMTAEERDALQPMPYIVIVIDELADLMLQARKDVEPCIIRLAQLARACGIHMIIATQRPSVDVVTGLIKANFPCRVSFKVSSGQDSRTTLGSFGAEKLLGMGDMFYLPNGGNMTRLHGPFLRDDEVLALVEHWKKQAKPEYGVDFTTWTKEGDGGGDVAPREPGIAPDDPMYRQVLDFALENGKVSTSLIQRRFQIGFNKAARYMDQLDKDGYVGPAPGAGKPRPVIMH